MSWFFLNSFQHYTTEPQAEDKIAYTGIGPVASVGAFGQPGTRTAQDALGEVMNFTQRTTVVVQAHLILEAQTGKLIEWYNADGCQCSIWVFSDGSFRFYRGQQVTSLILSAAAAIQFNVQHSVRLRVDFSDSLGVIQFYIDNTAVFDTSSLDTTQQTDQWCTQIRIFSAGSTGIALGYWSHIALGDASTDGASLQPLCSSMFATSDGGDETMTQVGGTGGDAYTTINETTPNDATYLEGDTPAERNSFFFNNPPAALAQVLAVQSVARVWKTTADVREGKPYVKIGGVRYYGTTVPIPADAAYLTYVWNTNPSTAVAWTPADITAPIESGWEVVT